jgi:gamma-glutamylcyclotransferase (GGCT)/AIG2-like uncharacterized protein YtfP
MKLKMIKLFAYGTLLDQKIQIELFGEKISGTMDSISGYRVIQGVKIEGIDYVTLIRDKNNTVVGKVYNLTDKQLKIVDEYETSSYERILIKTNSGIDTFVYKAIL